MVRTTISVLVLLAVIMAAENILAGTAGHDANTELMKKIKMVFKELHEFVQSPGKPKGTPFTPLLSKPLPHHRVAIVGAGLAGLHIAYLLKKNNITNVVVLEKDSRFGGKVMSVQHNGVAHELGACYTSPDYIQNVYELAHELGINKFVPIPPATVLLDRDELPFPILLPTYVTREVMKLTGAKSPLRAVANVFNATYRYSILHRRLFGKYKGGLMAKPSRKVLSQLNQTMLSFLTKHNLLALVPVLLASSTRQGYGHLDRISTVYGMMWNTPNFLVASIARALGIGAAGCKLFRDGFMQLTDKLASMTDVRLSVNIEKVERRDCDGIAIKFSNATHCNVVEKFDYLIWAADAREALKVFHSTTSMEKSFSRQTNTWFTTRLYDSTQQCRSLTPITFWASNMKNKREHSIWAQRNSKFVMTGERCNTTITDRKNMSLVSYQMGDTKDPSLIDAKFQQFLKDYSAQDVQIIKERSWNYFPRFSVRDMADGMLWKVAERQGERDTWFVGSSVSFESTKGVVEYNKLMIERMKSLPN